MTVRAACLCALILMFSALGLTANSSRAYATTTCAFAIVLGNTMLLLNDCTTDTAILVPDGMTLDGNGHSITAIETTLPLGSHFTGAVVANATAPSTIHVTNLTIRGQLGIDACDGGEDRLRGILFSGANGTITNNTLFNIRQGPSSGCQEGNAIEVRNFPGEETLSSTTRVDVSITDNVAQNYQKTGILVNGLVDAIVGRNTVQGDGPSTVIAQNGIQIGFGATALVSANTITRNDYTPTSFFACGIIVVEAGGVDRKQQDNFFESNEKDVCGFHKGGNYEPFGN